MCFIEENMNKLTLRLHNKGYSVVEFLVLINRTDEWYYKHSNGGKDYNYLCLAIDGLKDKLNE
jgi:hypothetical protein